MSEVEYYKMLINGQWVDAANGERFVTVNPTTGEDFSSIPQASEEDVNRAVDAAYHAFENSEWTKLKPSDRGKLLRKLGDLLSERSEELGKVETYDTGKLFKETQWQARYIAEFFYFYAGAADKISGETLPIDKDDLFVFTNREALGVVAAIVPWNSQLFLTAAKIAPALAAGNTVVLKVSEHASAPILTFGKLIKEAGFPDGVFNMITGYGEPAGRVLTSHPKIAKIAFTGGTKAARFVVQNSSYNFAQTSLELGGKSPFIVFDDADVESALNGCVGGIFAAAGQSCVAGSRLYVHKKISAMFLDKLITIAEQIKIGDPMLDETQMGPLCTTDQIHTIEKELAFSKTQGATILTGGKKVHMVHDNMKNGQFFEPTIVHCPNQQCRIVDKELFGPVLSVVEFESEEEVIALANDTQYGLAAGIFTQNSARSLRVAQKIKAGIIWVNTYRVISPIAAFGGMKNSGYGRESGLQAMLDYTRPKTIWMNMSNEPLASQFVAR